MTNDVARDEVKWVKAEAGARADTRNVKELNVVVLGLEYVRIQE
jgi:hypothetical protein